MVWRFTQGVASLALGYELLPLQGVPAKTRPHRKVLRMRKIRGNPLRRRRIKNQSVGTGARVNDP